MCRETVEILLGSPGKIFVDATLGYGGHAERLLENIEDSVLFGIDCDPDALSFSRERLSRFGNRVKIIRGRFGDLDKIALSEKIPMVSGVLFDLGISSAQIENSSRGMSFMKDARLDMRMDPAQKLTAFDVVNEFPTEELRKILRRFGEVREAGAIARAITRKRENAPISTTTELANIVKQIIPNCEISNLAKIFQAFRIAVNDELNQLSSALEKAFELLETHGRIIVISYHSLEDRIVKNFIALGERNCICPPDLPVCRCGHRKVLKRLFKKPMTPSKDEIERNRGSRSAKLRAFEKII